MRIEKLIIPFIFYVITTPFSLLAQQKLTMQECQQWAIEQSSASSQLENLERLRQIKRQVIKSFIPEISLNASASYQSHTLPTFQSENNPSFLDINNPINKDQYLISLDLIQKIWDGGISKSQQKYDDITSDIAVQNVHITSYEFKEEIGKMFLTVLYLQENIKVIESSILTLKEDLKKLKALFANGIILESNVYILEAEIMRIEQELKQIEMQQQSIRSALSEFTKKDLQRAEFVLTVTESIDTTLQSNRPEFTIISITTISIGMPKESPYRSKYAKDKCFCFRRIWASNL
jgi:outer membrane protein TolC